MIDKCLTKVVIRIELKTSHGQHKVYSYTKDDYHQYLRSHDDLFLSQYLTCH